MKKTGLIVALDTVDLGAARKMAESLQGRVSALKVGLTLFGAHGPDAIEELRPFAPIFCDLKLHDIPNQIGKTTEVLARLGVWMTTVHASGGAPMITEAVGGARRGAGSHEPPIIAAVTVLTSLSSEELALVGQGDDPIAQAARLALLAVRAGAGAVVCSGQEIKALRSAVGPSVAIVVPGVRTEQGGEDDQARVVSPSKARDLGADYIVVGRPITEAADPSSAAEQIVQELGTLA